MVTKFLVSRKTLPALDMLTRFTPLDRLSAAALEQVVQSSSLEEIPPGKLIFKPGQSEEESLFLVCGEITLISDDRVVDTVVAGSEAARGELGAERPRELWGWTTTRVTIVRTGTETLRALVARARPKRGKGRSAHAKPPTGNGAARELGELQAHLAAVEEERTAAGAEAAALSQDLHTLQHRLEETEAALALARDQLRAQEDLTRRLKAIESERKLAEAEHSRLADQLEAAREELRRMHAGVGHAGPATADRSPTSRVAAGGKDVELPALRVDPAQRNALAPEELAGFRLTPVGAANRRGDKRAAHQRSRERVDG